MGWWTTCIGCLAIFLAHNTLAKFFKELVGYGMNFVYLYHIILALHVMVQDSLNLIAAFNLFPLFAEKELTYWEEFLNFFGLL